MSELDHQWMCDLCFKEGKEIGRLAPGYSLIYNEGKYHILGGQGHRDDEIVTFPTTPWVDPDPECDLDHPDADRWDNETDALNEVLKMDVHEAYCFLSQCRKYAGWDGCQLFSHWLMNKAGKMIAETTGAQQNWLMHQIVDLEICGFESRRSRLMRYPNPEHFGWLLLQIHHLNEQFASHNNYTNLPIHRNIWRGSYDVWETEQDRIDAVEIPKRRMQEAKDAGFIVSEKIMFGKYEQEVWHLTELGLAGISDYL